MKAIAILTALYLAITPGLAIPLKPCLEENFSIKISHRAAPFGLFSKKLFIRKSRCEITVKHESYKVFRKSWAVDVCREPVHIKAGGYSVDVLKKEDECPANDSPFCESFQDLKHLMQDDGLIFARGEKEDLSSEHGKVYCAYILLNKYLEKGKVLSRHGNIDEDEKDEDENADNDDKEVKKNNSFSQDKKEKALEEKLEKKKRPIQINEEKDRN